MKYREEAGIIMTLLHYADRGEVFALSLGNRSGPSVFNFWAEEKGENIHLDTATIEEFCFEDRRDALLKALEYVDARSDAIRAELTCEAFRESVPSAKVAAGRLFKYVKEGMK